MIGYVFVVLNKTEIFVLVCRVTMQEMLLVLSCHHWLNWQKLEPTNLEWTYFIL